MKSFLMRLTSRKFLLALGGFITLVAQGMYTEAMGVLIAYISAEGVADVAERYNAGTPERLVPVTPESHNDENVVDETTVVTGNTPLFDEQEKNED